MAMGLGLPILEATQRLENNSPDAGEDSLLVRVPGGWAHVAVSLAHGGIEALADDNGHVRKVCVDNLIKHNCCAIHNKTAGTMLKADMIHIINVLSKIEQQASKAIVIKLIV